MKLLIFGASGATGRVLVSAALAKGHAVTAFARTPSKLAVSHENLRVIVGDVADHQAVTHAVSGHEAVFSCLGVGVPLKHDPAVVSGIGFIVDAMQRSGPCPAHLSFVPWRPRQPAAIGAAARRCPSAACAA